LSYTAFELPKSKVEIRESIPKPETENESTLLTTSIGSKIHIDLKKDKRKKSKKGKSAHQLKIKVKVEKQIDIPKIDKPKIKGDLSITVFELPKSKVEIRKSIQKTNEDIDLKVSIPKRDVKVDLNLKKDGKRKEFSSSSSYETNKSEKGGIDLNISGKVKTTDSHKPKIQGNLNIRVFELPKSKVEIRK
jgi:hypothetical protein